jgi:undecaprenyl-diphosphatase
MSGISYLQAVVIGALQGVSELFPVSSLGHSVLVPAWIGGSWHRLVTEESSAESPYLAFLVGLHVATAIALLVYFRAEWVRVIRGFFRSLSTRRIEGDADAKVAWLVIVATIPVGIVGLALEHALRVLFAKPLAAAIFLTLNGVLLLAGERLRRRASETADAAPDALAGEARVPAEALVAESVGAGAHRSSEPRVPLEDRHDVIVDEQPYRSNERGRPVTSLSWREAVVVGLAQSLALLAGISRSGVTMVAGLTRGLSHEDAARFAFLLATPVIFLAGVYKLPDLFGPNGNGVRGPIIVGSIVAGIAAYLSVRFLDRWFQTRNLKPFAIYCLVAGVASVLRFAF